MAPDVLLPSFGGVGGGQTSLPLKQKYALQHSVFRKNVTHISVLEAIVNKEKNGQSNMETIITIADLLILGLIISTPILLLSTLEKFNTKWTFLVYFLIGLIVLAILIFVFSWWCNESNLILLKHYGYNIDGMNETEFYGNVSPENRERVNSLVTSVMGIGWPLKTVLGYVFAIPYLLFIYLGKLLIKRLC